jgi:hypothetical protein
MEISGARQQDNAARGANQIGLNSDGLHVVFLLRMPRRRDAFAKAAGMIATKRFRDRLGKRNLL